MEMINNCGTYFELETRFFAAPLDAEDNDVGELAEEAVDLLAGGIPGLVAALVVFLGICFAFHS